MLLSWRTNASVYSYRTTPLGVDLRNRIRQFEVKTEPIGIKAQKFFYYIIVNEEDPG